MGLCVLACSTQHRTHRRCRLALELIDAPSRAVRRHASTSPLPGAVLASASIVWPRLRLVSLCQQEADRLAATHASRVLFPKLQELALAYTDVAFIKVDVDELEVRLE